MAEVMTVLGPIDSSDLGFTLMHEHLLVGPAGAFENYPEVFGEKPMERVVESLIKARDAGVTTFVDATTPDLNRNIELMAAASRESGVHIIACTGWWLDYPRFFNGMSSDQLAEMFIRDIRKGIAGTGHKAGILKSASDIGGVTPNDEIVLRAVARAHRETRAPIMLHSYSPGQVGHRQLAVLIEEGVCLNRVKLDHSNDTTDVEYLIGLMDRGCYLGLDRYPGMLTSSESRTKTLKSLIDAGYADRLCPSHDGIVLRPLVADPMMSEAERLHRNPYGFLYIKRVVIPRLKEMGVPDDVLDGLCVNGPRNFFEEK